MTCHLLGQLGLLGHVQLDNFGFGFVDDALTWYRLQASHRIAITFSGMCFCEIRGSFSGFIRRLFCMQSDAQNLIYLHVVVAVLLIVCK